MLAFNAASCSSLTFPSLLLSSFLIKEVLYAISWRGCGGLGLVGAFGGEESATGEVIEYWEEW
jgi:hypothetical protein